MAWKPELGKKAAIARTIELGEARPGRFSFSILEGTSVYVVGQKTRPDYDFEAQPRDITVMVLGFPFFIEVAEIDLRESK